MLATRTDSAIVVNDVTILYPLISDVQLHSATLAEVQSVELLVLVICSFVHDFCLQVQPENPINPSFSPKLACTYYIKNRLFILLFQVLLIC